jgi:putative transposase
MTRVARVVVPGIPHHLTQRGNRRANVFFSDNDRQRYLQLLLQYSRKYGLETLAYCLMTNRIHLICVPENEKSLSLTLKPVNMRYAQHVNWTLGSCGRLWQGRFYSCVLDDDHLWAAIRYVEQNPVRARMVRRAEDYAWSSAAAHCGLRQDSVLSPLSEGCLVASADWSVWLAEGDQAEMLATLRLHTRTGRPAGGKHFIAALESKPGRTLQAKPIGRPLKAIRESI